MGDNIRIEPGFHPWQPGYESELIEVLAQFDVPTAGILLQGGNYYVFWCLEGVNAPKSLWAYTLLKDADVDGLRSVTGAPEGFEKIADLVQRGPVTVALADEQEGVVLSTAVQPEPRAFDSPEDVALQLVEDAYWAFESHLDPLRDQLKRSHGPDERRRTAV